MKEKYMNIAINEAKKAFNKGEVPVGAVIVKNDKIIAKSYNTIEKEKNATKHAEMKVINKASKKLNNWRLIDCDLYVTLEPCIMCKGAISLSRIKNVYYILSQKKIKNIIKTSYIKTDIQEKEYLKMLQVFFKSKRK